MLKLNTPSQAQLVQNIEDKVHTFLHVRKTERTINKFAENLFSLYKKKKYCNGDISSVKYV